MKLSYVKAFNFRSLFLESLEFIQLFEYFSLPVNSPLSVDVGETQRFRIWDFYIDAFVNHMASIDDTLWITYTDKLKILRYRLT